MEKRMHGNPFTQIDGISINDVSEKGYENEKVKVSFGKGERVVKNNKVQQIKGREVVQLAAAGRKVDGTESLIIPKEKTTKKQLALFMRQMDYYNVWVLEVKEIEDKKASKKKEVKEEELEEAKMVEEGGIHPKEEKEAEKDKPKKKRGKKK